MDLKFDNDVEVCYLHVIPFAQSASQQRFGEAREGEPLDLRLCPSRFSPSCV